MKTRPRPKQTPAEAPDGMTCTEMVRRTARNVLAGLVPVLFAGFFLANPLGETATGALVVALVQRVLMIALAAAVVGVAALFGMRLLRWMRVTPERLLERFLMGAGLGLGALALATLGLGCVGLIGPGASAGLLGVMFLVGLGELRVVGNALRRSDRERTQPLSLFELALVAASLVVLLFGLILAFNLPTDYDTCEYHLAAPARWFALGRIGFIEGNVFSNLPMNCEMLHLFSMGLTNDVMLGIHLAVVMNALTGVLAAAAVYAMTRRIASRRAALAAAALFATTPWVLIVTTVNVYNEMLLAFYLTLALHAFLIFAERPSLRWAVLSAVFAGLAAGVKYTALAFLPLGVGVPMMLAARGWPAAKRVATGLLYAAVVVAVVSPWLAKNAVLTGNPTYPFFWSVFGGRDWSPEQAATWVASQRKAADVDTSGDLMTAVWRRVVGHAYGSLAVAGFLVLGVAIRPGRREVWLMVFLALWTVFWYACTHRAPRFWIPMLPVAAVLAGRGTDVFRGRWARLAVSAALVGALGFCLFLVAVVWQSGKAGSYDLIDGNDRFLEQRYPLYPLIVFARILEPEDRLMLVGEAQSLYLPVNVSYSTIFDREVFTRTTGETRDPAEAARRLRAAGVTHVFVNWAEVARLRRTYPSRTDGSGLGMVSPAIFDGKDFLAIPFDEVDLPGRPVGGRPVFELYEVAPAGATEDDPTAARPAETIRVSSALRWAGGPWRISARR